MKEEFYSLLPISLIMFDGTAHLNTTDNSANNSPYNLNTNTTAGSGLSAEMKTYYSDYLIDKKVSMAEKSRQFVLLSGDDIVWVIGRRLDDRYAITRKTENVLKVVRESL